MVSDKNNRLFTYVLILLIIINLFAIGVSSADEPEPNDNTNETESMPFDTITTTVQIDPGDAFYIYFDPQTLELEAKPPYDLPEECDMALDIVPEWLRSNLSYKFRQLSSDFRTIYANLILNSPDERYVDEIAFSIAHSAVENLEDDYFFPELLTHNSQLIYDNDQYLNYVEVVERGDYTTVIYKDRYNSSVELPKDLYYWFIVLPKLSDELPTYVDPDYNFMSDPPFDRNYGVPPPTGKFWRDWLFYYNDSGYPLLKEYLEDSYTLWEAISACNSWISGSMSFTSDEERPIQPVRIYRKHIGRCGEYQDMRNAIARAGLIPSTCTLNTAEDHVWNEFWDQRWIHWDGTIDNPLMYERGWGKDLSSVWNTIGDSNIWSVTSKYTDTCNFTATVLDASGLPVDGALVDVATENYYNPELLSTTTWGITDYSGTVTIPLGDVRNYWSSAETDDLGTEPLNGVTQVITDSQVGVNYTYTFNLPLSAPALKANNLTPPGGDIEEEIWMEVSYEVVANIMNAENSFTGEHGDQYGSSGNVDFFITDQLNYNLYDNGLIFNAYYVYERSTSGEVAFFYPNLEDRHYAVLSNEFSQETTKIVDITVNIISDINLEITSPEEGSEFDQGNSVHITGTSWALGGVDNVEIDVDDFGNWAPATDTSSPGEDPYSSWEFYLDTIEIKPGAHKILARASQGGRSLVVSINISLRDVTNPDISIESPTEGSKYMLGEILIVNGTAMDNGVIQVLKLVIDSDEKNSIDLIPHLVDGFWSFEISTDELGYGQHTITIFANDSASNHASITRNIKVIESVEPYVRIQSPSEGRVFKKGDAVKISGVATDNMEVLRLEIIIDNKAPIDITSMLNWDGSWSYNWDTGSSYYKDGWHVIVVWVTDTSGNDASDEVNIVLDADSPEVSINFPEYDEIFKAGDTITLMGIASDEGGIDEVLLQFDNDSPIEITRKVVNDNWQYDYWKTQYRDSGEHTISVSVTDSVGHNSVASVTLIIDAQEPEVDIVNIDESVEIGDSITLRGTAFDDVGIKEISLVIDYEDPIVITHTLKNGYWEYVWDTTGMTKGKHMISVIATDKVNNEVSDAITVRFVQETEVEEGSAEGSSEVREQDDILSFLEDGVVIMFILIIIFLAVLVLVLYRWSGKVK